MLTAFVVLQMSSIPKCTVIPRSRPEKLTQAKMQFTKIYEYCRSKYNLPLPSVKWDGRGRTRLGYCVLDRNSTRVCYIRFNMEYLYNDEWYLDMINNTIAHELAHAVVHKLGIKETAHGKMWKKICLELGGDGKALCHHPQHRPFHQHRPPHQHEIPPIDMINHIASILGTDLYRNITRR